MPPRPCELGHTVLKVPLLTFLLPVMCSVIGGIIPPSQELGEWSTPCGEAPRTGPVNGVVLHKGRVIFVCNKNVKPVHFSLRGWAASLITRSLRSAPLYVPSPWPHIFTHPYPLILGHLSGCIGCVSHCPPKSHAAGNPTIGIGA